MAEEPKNNRGDWRDLNQTLAEEKNNFTEFGHYPPRRGRRPETGDAETSIKWLWVEINNPVPNYASKICLVRSFAAKII